MATCNNFNLSSLWRCAVVTVCALVCLGNKPTLTSALPLTDLIRQELTGHDAHKLQKREVSQTNCAQPSNLEQLYQQVNSHIAHTAFLQRATNGTASNVSATENFTISEGDPNECKTCPTSITRDPDAILSHRSLCPYYFNILTLPTGYYPATLKSAECKCVTCIEADRFGCEKILTPIVVLRPVGCFQGMQRYEQHRINVPTACTCAFKGAESENVDPVSPTTPVTTTTTTKRWGVDV